MRPATVDSYRERILRTLLYIQGRLDEPLDLDDLARVACFSPFHFHRVFRSLVGEPVHEHVRRLRLERAAGRLKLQDLPVTEIAFEAGYESHEAFTRAFTAMFKMPPSQFRTAHQGTPDSPSGVHFADVANYHPPEFGEPPQVEIKNLTPQRIAFVRHIGPYNQVGLAWGKLCGWAGPRGLLGPATRFIGVSYDDPQITPPEKLRYDAAVVIDAPVQPEGEVGVTELAGGDYATILHKGPYEELSRSYGLLMGNWLPASGRELRNAPPFEIYLNAPDSTPPENLLTLIHVPLE